MILVFTWQFLERTLHHFLETSLFTCNSSFGSFFVSNIILIQLKSEKCRENVSSSHFIRSRLCSFLTAVKNIVVGGGPHKRQYQYPQNQVHDSFCPRFRVTRVPGYFDRNCKVVSKWLRLARLGLHCQSGPSKTRTRDQDMLLLSVSDIFKL